MLDDQRVRSQPWGRKDQARKKTHESQVQEYLESRGASSEELRVQRALPHYWRTQQWATEESRAGSVKYILDKEQEESQTAKEKRKERRAQLKADARALYGSDPSFQRMFDATADIFADALRAEQTRLDAGNTIAIPGSLTASSSVSTQQPRRTRQMAPATRSTLATCATATES